MKVTLKKQTAQDLEGEMEIIHAYHPLFSEAFIDLKVVYKGKIYEGLLDEKLKNRKKKNEKP